MTTTSYNSMNDLEVFVFFFQKDYSLTTLRLNLVTFPLHPVFDTEVMAPFIYIFLCVFFYFCCFLKINSSFETWIAAMKLFLFQSVISLITGNSFIQYYGTTKQVKLLLLLLFLYIWTTFSSNNIILQLYPAFTKNNKRMPRKRREEKSTNKNILIKLIRKMETREGKETEKSK